MLKLKPAIKLLGELGTIVTLATAMIDQLKKLNLGKLVPEKLGSKELQNAVTLQAEIIEQLGNQMKIVQSVLVSIQKSVRILGYISYSSAALAVIAIVLLIIR